MDRRPGAVRHYPASGHTDPCRLHAETWLQARASELVYEAGHHVCAGKEREDFRAPGLDDLAHKRIERQIDIDGRQPCFSASHVAGPHFQVVRTTDVDSPQSRW